jgi:hypothetical protein
MRHFVNYALLFFVLVLAISGLLSFIEPFKLLITRIHIVFGFGTVVLVIVHVVDRWRYFRKSSLSNRNKGLPSLPMTSALAIALLMLAAAMGNWWPVRAFIDLGYEARNKAIIFRSDSHTAFKPIDNGALMKHAPEGDAQVRLEIEWGPRALETDASPQIAIWAENTVGMMIKTFFVSEKSAYAEELRFGDEQVQRADILPVWRHRYTLLTGVDPDGHIDGASAATPDHSFSIDDYLRADSSPFYIYVEVNLPGDGNEVYTDDQPSVIYGAYIESDQEKAYYLLPLVAHGGSGQGPRGHMFYDVEKIGSARDLIEKILVKVVREWE